MARQTCIYKTADGHEPYSEFVDLLKDRQGAVRIKVRVKRAQMGNLGDHRSVGEGVIELRVDTGPGYRIYLGLDGTTLMVLLGAGDKSSQKRDIQQAHAYWEDYWSDR